MDFIYDFLMFFCGIFGKKSSDKPAYEPLSEEQIDSKVLRYKNNIQSSESCCVICFTKIRPNDLAIIRRDDTHTIYHKSCIERWSTHSQTNPLNPAQVRTTIISTESGPYQQSNTIYAKVKSFLSNSS